MKLLFALLLALLIVLQYKLWFADGGISQGRQLREKVEAQQEVDRLLEEQNQQLLAEIDDLKNGDDALEEQARSDLGLIKEGEVYYQF